VDNGFMTADDLTETTVRVKKLSPRQLGVYTCRAQNKLGSAEREFLVTESYQPNCVIGQCDDFAAKASSSTHVSIVAIVLGFFFARF
jgi:hypothetical protein